MPNRTVYLPDDLDAISRALGLNLSQVTQEAIRRAAADRSEEAVSAFVDEATERIRALNIDWTNGNLAVERDVAGER